MTREQAIKILASELERNKDYHERWIDALIALDILKVEKPRSAISIEDAIGAVVLGPISKDIASGWRIGPGFDGAQRVVCALEVAGYRIVKADK